MRRIRPTVFAAALGASGLLGAFFAPVAAAAPPGTVTGSAGGVTASLVGIHLGPLPGVTLPPSGATQTAQLVSASVPGLLSTGVVTVSTSGTPATGSVSSASDVSGINLLGGVVQSGTILTTCSVGPSGPVASVTIENLTIAGRPITVTANETLAIPGVGSIVLDQQSTSSSGSTQSASATAVVINVNALLLPAGSITIGQANCGGTPLTAPVPAVSSVSPNSGPSTGGTSVTITGSGFTGATAVDFGGTPATGVTVNNDGSITATTPEHLPGGVDVTVTTPGGTSPIGSGDVFTYTASGSLPTVTSVSPNLGPTTGGTTVTITGTNFTPDSTVSFGGTPASLVTVSNSSITVSSPAHPAGSVDVTVTSDGGTSTVTHADAFTFLGVPNPLVTVLSVSPTHGPTSGGTSVTITGVGFTNQSTVSFGGTPATGVTFNLGVLTATSPAHAAGTVDVQVTTPGLGTSAPIQSDTFTFIPGATPPTITSVNPNVGNPGTPVTITGTGFDPTATVDFGNTPGTGVVVISPTTIQVTAPPHAPGTVPVTVTDEGGTSAVNGHSTFTYPSTSPANNQPPVVTGVNPRSGPVAGGTPITITGSNFTGTTQVHVGTVSVPFTVVNSGTIRVVTPPGTAGTTFVTVTTPHGTSAATLASTFTYLSPGGASGYWEVADDGGIFTFGHAVFYGSTGSDHVSDVIGMVGAPDGRGYWLAGADGNVYPFGDAGNHGNLAGTHLNSPIVAIAATADGRGYWLVAADGGIFAFGDAGYFGSMGGHHLNSPIVGMASTADGGGYWLVAADGGMFSFGDAHFYGSMGGRHLNKPVIGMTSTNDGHGYWEVATDGGIFTFGDAVFQGSMGGHHLNQPIVGIAATPDGGGYWMDATDGGIFAFGDAPFYGSMGGHHLNRPMNGMTATSTLHA